jgi:hypothetical protein
MLDMSPRRILCAALLVAGPALPGTPVSATSEIGALHLAFAKPVRLRKLAATLYLSYAEPQRDDAGALSCAVLPMGAAGRLAAKGTLRLRLSGATAGAPWESSSLAATLDGRGEARFTASEMEELAGEAPPGTSIELVEIVLAGGKGKRVSTLTVDCAREEAE